MPQTLTYSAAEAAQVLGVGLRSIYQAIRDGRLPAIRVGRKPRLRIPKTAVEMLLRHPELWMDGGTETSEPGGVPAGPVCVPLQTTSERDKEKPHHD